MFDADKEDKLTVEVKVGALFILRSLFLLEYWCSWMAHADSMLFLHTDVDSAVHAFIRFMSCSVARCELIQL